MPPFTLLAMTISFFGAFLMLFGNNENENKGSNNTSFGIGLAFFGTLLQSIYMIYVKKTTSEYKLHPNVLLFFVGTPSILLSFVSLMVYPIDFTSFYLLNTRDWILFIIFAFIRLIAHVAQTNSISHLGAPFDATLMPSRVFSSLLLSVFLLNEETPTSVQICGMIVVLLTVTFYLSKINNESKAKH